MNFSQCQVFIPIDTLVLSQEREGHANFENFGVYLVFAENVTYGQAKS